MLRRKALQWTRHFDSISGSLAETILNKQGSKTEAQAILFRCFAAQSVENAATTVAAAATARTSTATTNTSPLRRFRALLRDYKQLSKARLSALVVATSAAGYVAGSPESIDWAGLGWTSLGTMLTAACANSLNQIYEIVNDGKMKRTALRPLPAGRMSRPHAIAFALVTGASGVAILWNKTNATTAALGAGNIALYAAVYTPLKQLSVINTWIGAVVGAVPPLMGWAAAAGELEVGSFLLAAGLYFWQMPHFMALAWLCKADYTAGGYRMLSLIDASGKRTAACALRNCMYLFPLGVLAAWLGVTSPYFAYESAFITGGMMLTAAKFYSSPNNTNARLLFRASLLHLPVFMIAFLLHRKPNEKEDRASLLLDEARKLGFLRPSYPNYTYNNDGSVVDSTTNGDEEQEEEVVENWQTKMELKGGLSAFGRQLSQVQLPPLPFLPVPHFQVSCPSKVSCQEEQQQQIGAGSNNASTSSTNSSSSGGGSKIEEKGGK